MFGRKRRQQKRQREKIEATADSLFVVLEGLSEVLVLIALFSDD